MIHLIPTKKNSRVAYLAVLAAIGIFCLYKVRTDLAPWYTASLSCCTYPLLKMYQHIVNPLVTRVEAYRTALELQSKIAALQDQCNTLQAQLIKIQADNWYAHDTDLLRLSATQYTTEKAHIAQIMVRHFSEQAHYFLVDAGKKQGITTDMIAVHNNCLLGRVIEVYPWYSKILLITDQNCKVAVLIGDEKVSGIHEGTNTENPQVNYVSHLKAISRGDLVLSSGQGLVFPYGFGLGTINTVLQNGVCQTIEVEPFVDFKELRYCTIISKAAKETQNT
jgi:rod shape-determining protein MreC